MMHLTRERAEQFYAVHKARPFFGELVDFMISGPILVQVLEGEAAVSRNREIMGATNPADAAAGTIRADFALEVTENAVHGSDCDGYCQRGNCFLFPTGRDLLPYSLDPCNSERPNLLGMPRRGAGAILCGSE